MQIHNEIEQQRSAAIELRRYFHAHPELSMKEYNTAQKIEEELAAAGILTKRIGNTGVLGVIKGKKRAGPKIVLRADIDALAIQDGKAVPYASQVPGVMHACGHDAHAAALITAGKVLAGHQEDLAGEILLVFQPGEEYGKGAVEFIQHGVLNGVQRVFGIHMDSSVPVGQVALSDSVTNASVDHLKIVVQGKSAHVSTPERGADALYIAAQIVVALQALITRTTNPTDPVIIGIGVLHAGDAYNVVAKEAVLEGTIRCHSAETRKNIKKKIQRAAEQISEIYGGTALVEYENFASPVVNDPVVYKEVYCTAIGLLGEENLRHKPATMGGDDFAEFLQCVPGIYAFVGSANPEKPNTTLAHHTNLYDIDEQAILIAAGLYVEVANTYLK